MNTPTVNVTTIPKVNSSFKDVVDIETAAAVLTKLAHLAKMRVDGDIPPAVFAFTPDTIHVLDVSDLFPDVVGKNATASIMKDFVRADSSIEGIALISEVYVRGVERREDAPASLADDPDATEAIMVHVEWRNRSRCTMLTPLVTKNDNGVIVVELGEAKTMVDGANGNKLDSRFFGAFD